MLVDEIGLVGLVSLVGLVGFLLGQQFELNRYSGVHGDHH